MPHQCVRCNIFYDDGASEILKGCKCGSRLFFYVRKDAIKRAKELTTNLTDKDKHQIEKDVLDLVDISGDETPVILDLESVRILGPGKFELDLVQLFNKDYPLIYKLDEGKYVIDIVSTFDAQKRKNIKIDL